MDCSIVLNLLESLELAQLDSEWVDRMHAAEFTEEPNVNINLPNNADQLLEACNSELRKNLMDSAAGDNTSIWNEMAQSGISNKVIQAWVYYLFSEGLKMSAGFRDKQLCVLSSDFYFLMLKLPGMMRSDLHHAILFEKATNAMHMALTVDVKGQGDSQGRKRKANVPSTQSQKRRRQGSDPSMQEDGEENQMEIEITPRECAILVKHATVALTDFCQYLARVSLRPNEISIKQAVQVLTKIVNYLKSNCPVGLVAFDTFKSDGSTVGSLNLPYQLAIYALFLIISKKNGELDKLCLLLFQFLIPILLMRDANIPSTTVPRAFLRNSEIMSKFVCILFDVHGDAVSHSVMVLTQNLIAQCPDRTEFRNNMSTIVSCISHHMPLSWYGSFCDWLRRMSVHSKINYRNNALAAVGQLLCLPEISNSESSDQANAESDIPTQHGLFLKIAVSRLNDSAPSVRSRALTVMIDMMEQGVVSPAALLQIMDSDASESTPNTPIPYSQTTQLSVAGKTATNTPATLHTVTAPSASSPVVCNQSVLLQLLMKCTSEPKAMVRKTAVHALEMALKTGFLTPSKESMEILENRCRDPSVMVRKQAIASITEVLMHHKDCSQAQESWVKGIFPTIHDAESSVQEKSAALIESTILNNIGDTQERSELAWNLIMFFASQNGQKYRIYLQTVCRQWKRQMKIDNTLLKKVVSRLNDESRSSAAWLFTRYLTLYVCSAKTATDIVEEWKREHGKEQTLLFHINSIVTLGRIASHLNQDVQDEVKNICIQKLRNVHYPIQLISHLVETICNFIEASHKKNPDGSEWPQPLMDWCKSMLDECDSFLYEVIMNHSKDNTFQDEKSLVHYLYVAGDVGKHYAMKVPKRLQLSLQALLTSVDCLDGMSQPLQASQFAGSQEMPQSQPLSQFHQNGGVPQHIRAHAIINLGKICLHNPPLAKKCVPAIVRELDTCDSDMVKNNVLIILTDLCVQQTQLIDPHLADIANCLGDESRQLRKNTLILLNSLLKKDFIKWRGSLIFKFLSLLCDKVQEIRDLVKFSLLEQTLRRNVGDTFFRHFVESIFYFNNYHEHNTYNRFVKSDRESRLFNFSGENKSSDRMLIYTFMLTHIDDEHRVKLTAKLCSDVLEAIVDNVVPLSNKTSGILSDALAVLCCQELKLKCMRVGPDEEEMEEMQNEPAASAKNAMKQKIISHVVKRNLVENIIPIIVALKNHLVSRKSPLVKNVMLYLKEVMKDYKTEVQDILSVDKQLAGEIEFDLKRFEREQEERLQANLAPAIQSRPATPSRAAPGTPGRSGPVTPNRQSVATPGRQGTPNRQVGSLLPQPASQNMKTPARTMAGTPPRTPGAIFTTPGQRHRGLGVTAILNSVRRGTARMKITEKENGIDPEDTGVTEEVKRAISTPAKTTALSDLTFSNLTEISMILTPLTHVPGSGHLNTQT